MNDIFIIVNKGRKKIVNKKNQENPKATTLKGLKIQTVSLWIALCTALVAILIGYSIMNVKKQYRQLTRMSHKYTLTQKDAMNISLGSDYLTEQARLYIITKEQLHADAYFMETDVTQRRERALLEIEKQLSGDDEVTLQLSKDALRLSNALMDLELHAMKLAALSADADIARLSSEIRDYKLPGEELAYTSQEMADTASELLFGHEYRAKKQEIDDTLSNVTKSAIKVCEMKQEESEAAMEQALTSQSICTLLIVLLVFLAYAMIAVLILKPIRIYINCIKNNNFLEITGAYEFKYLAATYNNVYEMSQAQHNLLRQKAEHDALTGLLNRQAFEQIKDDLRTLSQPIALLLIDVDEFKSINDTYGHEIGDQALQKAASLLEESFRSADYIFRVGGDEFAAILQDVTPEHKEIIGRKIDRINRTLQHPPKDFPKYSVSIGAAFSQNGYEDELFGRADAALYHTKENGRCGYTFDF